MSALAKILDAVDRPTKSSATSWKAGCPCCRSRKGRPLAITDAGDGRVLLHAFCGCDTEAVLGALGLTITDLFDAPRTHASRSTSRKTVSARDVLEILSQEINFVALLAADLLERKEITQDDWQRLAKAAGRISSARDHIG